MPIVVKDEDVKWMETLMKMRVRVPLPNTCMKNVSISTASRYLQVSSPPYIWECFLNNKIDCESSVARLCPEGVTFDLMKKEQTLWCGLKHEKSGDKLFCKTERETALKEIERTIEDKQKQVATAKHEARRGTVKKQMHLDDEERKRIDGMKLEVKEQMAKEIEQWKQETAKEQIAARERTNSVKKVPVQSTKPKVKPIPLPRRSGEITVNFTPRAFPTAARESMEQEETQWLENQVAVGKSLEFDCSDLLPEQRNAVWLKEKADNLRKKDDFRGAVNAYSLAIRMTPSNYRLFTDRAFCHLQLRNLHKAIEDSSKALDLLRGIGSVNDSYRVKGHICRGKAFSELELYAEGLMDLEAALKLEPENEDLKQQCDKIRAMIQN